MGRIYDVFDKFSIFNIIIGLILGIYLGFHHNDSELWLVGVQFVIIIALIMTLMPMIAAMNAKVRYDENISIKALIEAFILNVAMLGVCTAFGVVIGSFIIGNFIID